MWSDLVLQAAIILLTISMFLFIHNVPQTLFSSLRLRLRLRRSNHRARRHFVLGAQLLSQSRSSSDANLRLSLAGRAAAEADRAVTLDPSDAASHILKALALEIQGFKTSALDSLDAALSPLAVKSLSDGEREEAMRKREAMRAAAVSLNEDDT